MVKRTTTKESFQDFEDLLSLVVRKAKDNKPGDYRMSTLAEANENLIANETDKSEAVPRCIAQLTRTTGVTLTDYSVYPSGFTLKVPCRRGAFRLCEACTLVRSITSVHLSEFDAEDGTWLVIVDY